MARNYENKTPVEHQRRPHLTKDDDWIRAFLRRGLIARIASRWDNQPFINTSTFYYDAAGHRIIFHSNALGRIRSNIERHPEVCVEVSELGKFLPANVSLEFSLQYRSVIVFGKASILEDLEDKRAMLNRLTAKYFGKMQADRDYRSAVEKEMKATSVYQVMIDAWSGKENWDERAEQSDEWPALDEKWFHEIFP